MENVRIYMRERKIGKFVNQWSRPFMPATSLRGMPQDKKANDPKPRALFLHIGEGN